MGTEGAAGVARAAGIHSAVCALPASSPMSVSSPGTLGLLGAGTGVNTPVAAASLVTVPGRRVTSAPGGGSTPVTALSSDEGGMAGFDRDGRNRTPGGNPLGSLRIARKLPHERLVPGHLGVAGDRYRREDTRGDVALPTGQTSTAGSTSCFGRRTMCAATCADHI